MIGVIVNVGAIILGGVIGLILHKGINEKVKKVIMQGIGLSVIVIGLSGALLTENMLLLVMSLVIGGLVGALIRIEDRLDKHLAFVQDRFQEKGKFKYINNHYFFPVMTRQETDLIINELLSVDQIDSDTFEVTYSDEPQKEYVGSWDEYVLSDSEKNNMKKAATPKKMKINHKQQQLF